MLSKNRAKFIVSLQKKKIRDREHLFVIEGEKLVMEFLRAGNQISTLIAVPGFINSLPGKSLSVITEVISADNDELKNISTLKTPHNALALIPMKEKDFNIENILEERSLALDCVQDPGNLGTIIRAASWFGIKNIICSHDCVDVYNPKVIQASMGALLNVNVYYKDLKDYIFTAAGAGIPVYGTLLKGESVYEHKLSKNGIILLGNEANGISGDLISLITEKITIPKFNDARYGIESLNVGMAASIVLSEFSRREF